MKKFKKSVLLSIIILCVCFFAGCTRDDRVDVSELQRRMTSLNESCSFSELEMFYKKPVYYVYYSFKSENDVLLTVREDKYMKTDRITVTALSSLAEEQDSPFILLCETAAKAFLPRECGFEELLANAGLYSPEAADAGGFSQSEWEKYTAWVYRGENTVSFTLSLSPPSVAQDVSETAQDG